jgi:AraC-like DNA-binding protein/effector-binding domain-containing protein
MKRTTPPPRLRVAHAAIAATASQVDDMPLSALAARAGLSPFYLHRVFSAVAGETPKQYGLRLRLSRAAAWLLTSDEPVLRIALSCGFRSPEVFTRAFRRQFGTTPTAYRSRGFAVRVSARGAADHRTAVGRVAPCVGLFHMALNGPTARSDMNYDVVKKELTAQPVLVVRKRVKRTEIAATIGSVLPGIFHHAQQRGLALSGHPFTRYPQIGPGMVTIEPGMRISGGSGSASAPGVEGVIEDSLPAGPAATTIHSGAYDTLSQAYAALEVWIESHGFEPAGAPWEDYITDPAEHPDPKDWKTEVLWPIRTR